MSIEFRCPGCNSSILAEEEEVGLIVNCPGCDSELVVPEGGSSQDQTTLPKVRIRPEQICVSSGSHPHGVAIVGPVMFCIGSRGGMRAEFDKLKATQLRVIQKARSLGQISSGQSLGQTIKGVAASLDGSVGLAVQHSGASFASDELEIAFHIAVAQLQIRASYLGANAIYGFRWDIDVDSNSNVINFLGTAYGTAVVEYPS